MTQYHTFELSRAELALLVELLPDAVVVIDPGGAIALVNAQVEALFGYPRDELAGQAVEILIPERYRTRHESHRARYLDRPGTRAMGSGLLLSGRRKDGTEFPIEISLSPLHTRAGMFVSSAIRDVSERQAAEALLSDTEERLRQSQKAEAIGRLAGGVAHEINNMMTVVLGCTDLLSAHLAGDEALLMLLADVTRAAERSATMTRRLLAFGRRQLLRPARTNLTALVMHTIPRLKRLMGDTVVLDYTPCADLWPAFVDAPRIGQVIVNLAVNARDAMPGGGTLRLATHNVRVTATERRAARDIPPGDYVALSLQDTGCGMDESTKTRVFEPFFTTKAIGEGVGLGLAVVEGIVTQSGGRVLVDSVVGQGTTFTIYLPRARGSLDAPRAG